MALESTLVAVVDDVGGSTATPVGHRDVPFHSPFLALRAVPLLGSAVFVVVVTLYVLWWLPVVNHVDAWWIPGDFWIDYFGTSALIHGQWATMYAAHTQLKTIPGVLVLLSPAVALGQILHLPLGMPYTAVSTPTTWLVLEPFDLAAGCAALISVDAVARRLEVPVSRRVVLTVFEGVALWDLLVNSWHPEDAFAVALLLWGVLAVFDGRWRRGGWLIGAAIAFQPLAALALVAVLAKTPRKRVLGFVVRAAVPGAVVLAGPLIANPLSTLRGVFAEDSTLSPLHHPTPWIALAPHLGHGVVAAGPARLVAVVVASVMSWVVCRRTVRPELILWTVALCFALRTLFEAVMVEYYIWPALAVALIVAARAGRVRFAAACALSSLATAFALRGWRGEWEWWSILVLCLGTTLVLAWPTHATGRPAGPPSLDPAVAGRASATT
jgi:hypothetical protein